MRCAPAAFALSLVLVNFGAHAQETPGYEVVAEYIRQLGTMNDIRKTALKEMSGSTNQMADAIRSSTRIKLELRRGIYALKGMKVLDKGYETLLPSVVQLYEKKIELHDSIIDIASQLVAGPKPGVDYTKLAATMPQITATLEYVDNTLEGTTPMFCLLLVDPRRVDDRGNVDHLRISPRRNAAS